MMIPVFRAGQSKGHRYCVSWRGITALLCSNRSKGFLVHETKLAAVWSERLLSVSEAFPRKRGHLCFPITPFTRAPNRRAWIQKGAGTIAARNIPHIPTRGTSLRIRSVNCLKHPGCTWMMDFTHASDYLNRIHNITGFYRPTQKAPGTKLFKLSEDGNNVTHAAKQNRAS